MVERRAEVGVLLVLSCSVCHRAAPSQIRQRPAEGQWPSHRCSDGSVRPFDLCHRPPIRTRTMEDT